jgi:hypothetical protein
MSLSNELLEKDPADYLGRIFLSDVTGKTELFILTEWGLLNLETVKLRREIYVKRVDGLTNKQKWESICGDRPFDFHMLRNSLASLPYLRRKAIVAYPL